MLRLSSTRLSTPIALIAPVRTKVILPGSHPYEYFRDTWNPSDPSLPKIYHPEPVVHSDGTKGPVYYKITLKRSLIGLPWTKRYEAGILFKKYQPEKRFKPRKVDPRINTHTTIFREASPEVAQLILGLKEIVQVENIWTVDEYKVHAKKLLGRNAMTPEQVQGERGYYVVSNAS